MSDHDFRPEAVGQLQERGGDAPCAAVRAGVRAPVRKKQKKKERLEQPTRTTPVGQPDLSVKIGSILFKNPFIAASGTYGFGREAAEFLDLSVWGGVSSKGITLEPREGNPTPRVAETAAGMLNAVGLQNPGVEAFIKDELPFMLQQNFVTLVNVAGSNDEDYQTVCRMVARTAAPIIELNLSCPMSKRAA